MRILKIPFIIFLLTSCEQIFYGSYKIIDTNLNEKISAISKKSKVYISDQNNHINDLIKRECVNKQCKYSFVKTNSKLDVSLKGEHQMQNASLAVEIAKDMGCRNTIINKALKKVKWYGRNQVISKSPDIIFDVAHNEEGVTSFLKYLNTLNKKYDRKYLLLSLQNKKNIKKMHTNNRKRV